MLDKLLVSRWFQIVLLLALLCAAVLMSFSHARWRQQIRNFTFDNYNISKPRLASDNIVIVDIDEASLKQVGQMPWPRSVMADMVKNLKDMGAAVIVFDIVFAEPDRVSPKAIAQAFANTEGAQELAQHLQELPDSDEAFGKAIGEVGNVVTGFSFTNEHTDSIPLQKGVYRGRDIEKFITQLPGATVNLKSIGQNAAGNGSFFVSTDTDGIIRRVPMLVAHKPEDSKIVSVYPSLSLETIRVLDGEKGGRVLMANPEYAKLDPARFGMTGIEIGRNKRVIPTTPRGEFMVYYARSNPAWYVSAAQILDKTYAAEKIKGRIVLIGTSAVGLKDIRSTPLDPFIPGVEVHLNIIDQVLQGKYLQRPLEAEGVEAVAIFAMGLLVILFAPFVGALSLAFIMAVVIPASVYAGWHAFVQYGLLIDVAYPALSIVVIFMLSTILTYLRTEREKRAVRQAFGLYISPDYMKELTKDPDKLRLGGETRDLTVMFTDIRSFTTISEGLAPRDLIQLMNDFLTPMSDLVMSNRGTIDKYMGDAMMAFWNAPLDDPDHARHACLTALGMQKALDPINAALAAKAKKENLKPIVLQCGIGINTGPAAVGNMGSKQRFAYSVLGDTVNLASRLEGQTKGYGVSIIAGEATARAAGDLAFLEADLIRVKGKTEPARIFILAGDEILAQSVDFKALKEKHDLMIAHYRGGRFAETLKLAEELLAASLFAHDEFYRLYKSRAETLLENPPKEWSGVYEAKTK